LKPFKLRELLHQVVPVDSYGLMLVTDRKRSRLPLPELVRLAVDGGVNGVQVREKDLLIPDLLDLTAQIVEAAAGRAWVVVNRSLDVAKELRTGIHLPEAGPTVEEARAILGESAIIGRSVHSRDAAVESREADYLVAGHIFATKSKPGRKPMTMDEFEAITKAVMCPVFAIGGVTADSIPSTMMFGAMGVAVVGAIAEAEDPRKAAADIRQRLDECAEKMG
jgi:thiazole tautomerase (transcriptional regulator TenI)